MYAKTEKYDGDGLKWIPIEYCSYWDFARTFKIRYREVELVFDAPFLEMADEYSDYFIVYLAKGLDENWRKNYKSWEVGHIVQVDAITFDESRKEYILAGNLDRLFINFTSAPSA